MTGVLAAAGLISASASVLAAGAVSIGADNVAGNGRNASWGLRPNGMVVSNGVETFQWINPLEGMSRFEARATVVQAPAPTVGSPVGVWIPIEQTPVWAYDANRSQPALLIEIARIDTGAIVGSAEVDFSIPGTQPWRDRYDQPGEVPAV